MIFFRSKRKSQQRKLHTTTPFSFPDYTVVVELFYPLIHPDCDEFTIDPATGIRSVCHFVNVAIVPDVFFSDDAVGRVPDFFLSIDVRHVPNLCP